MGYMRHNVIFVIGFDEAHVQEALREAIRLFGDVAPVSPILKSFVNGCHSFSVMPDGSKEGWLDSYRGDEARDGFIGWLREANNRELWLEWFEAAMPEDHESIITRRSYLGAKRQDETSAQPLG